MLTLLNYANHAFRSSQNKNSRTAMEVGGFDRVISVGPRDIPRDFYRKHHRILQAPKGNGYWLWKPYFIHRTLQELPEGDWLFYCDAGSYFIDSVRTLVSIAEKGGHQIMTFADAHPERHYSKREVLIALAADTSALLDSPQRLGGFSLWKNSPETRSFAATWLNYCSDPELLMDTTDADKVLNHPDFKAHRHDQSIFSLLAKKHGIPAFRDPSQWGNDRKAAYPNSPYPQLIELTRQRNIPLGTRIKRSLKGLLRLTDNAPGSKHKG